MLQIFRSATVSLHFSLDHSDSLCLQVSPLVYSYSEIPASDYSIMHFTTLLLVFAAAVSVCCQSTFVPVIRCMRTVLTHPLQANPVVPRAPEVTPAPFLKARDIISPIGSDIGAAASDIGDVASDVASVASDAATAISAAGGDIAGEMSSEIAQITSVASPLLASLASDLSSISTGSAASSIESVIMSLEASVSSATAAVATEAANATTSTAAGAPSSSSSQGGGSPAQTGVMGIGALMGGVVMLANM